MPNPASSPNCAECGNDGDLGALYMVVDCRWMPEGREWSIVEREDSGGGYIDCLHCDHLTPIEANSPMFPFGLRVQPSGRQYHREMSEQELATVLAALRYWQRCGEFAGDNITEIATNCGKFPEMDSPAIDALCERLNMKG